ncbi:uncharacterized protein Dyak_GE28322, isoform A [Drosophila yakuba]|uniref:Uncharacterized protein, isoform A n=2 Tax=Drosophila yakuba TaxID=7245 RepID=A0A0R1E7M1_DROYA|nr:uncharacterized protein Dyak_GE28322, isoform A [Drosophila yakuba]
MEHSSCQSHFSQIANCCQYLKYTPSVNEIENTIRSMESSVCRVCLVSCDDMVNVFDASHEPGLSIANLISKCTGFQVEKDDHLPNTICKSCLEDGKNAFDIIESYERSHQFYCFFKDVREEESENKGSCFSEEVESAGEEYQEEKRTEECVDSKDNNVEADDDDSGNEPDIIKSNGKAKDAAGFSCSHCPKSFRTKAGLKTHFRLHTGERPFKCSLCPKSFAYKCVRQRHMLTHTGERPFKCSRCPKAFSICHNLKVHMQIHEREESLKGSDCQKGILNSTIPKRLFATLIDNSKFQCSQCSKAFPDEHELKIHMRDHPERPFKCFHCPRDFVLDAHRKRHMVTHNGGYQALKTCGRKTLLRTQQLVVTKPSMCAVCSKMFIDNLALSAHLETHTERKAFKSAHCSTAFAHQVRSRHI